MTEKNEFEDLQTDANDFSVPTDDESSSETLIDTKVGGEVYDYNSAPDFIKAPPRIDLDGKIVTVKKADIILPPKETPWQKTRDGLKEIKTCFFKIQMETEDKKLQIETLSGIRVFRRENGYSHPSITRDEQNQASKLLGVYSRFKHRDIAETTLKELLLFLNGATPKAKIKTEEVTNPKTKEKFKKNLIESFVA